MGLGKFFIGCGPQSLSNWQETRQSYWAASVALGQVAHTVDSNDFNNQPNKSFAKRISYRLLFRLNINVIPKINK